LVHREDGIAKYQNYPPKNRDGLIFRGVSDDADGEKYGHVTFSLAALQAFGRYAEKVICPYFSAGCAVQDTRQRGSRASAAATAAPSHKLATATSVSPR
jgi:hypothetical protein